MSNGSTVWIQGVEQFIQVVGYLAQQPGVWFESYRLYGDKWEVSVDKRNSAVLQAAVEQANPMFVLVNMARRGFMAQEGDHPIAGEDPHTEPDLANVLDHWLDYSAEMEEPASHLRPHYLVPVSTVRVKDSLRKAAEGRVWCVMCGRYTMPEHQNLKRCGECGDEYDGEDPLAAWLKE